MRSECKYVTSHLKYLYYAPLLLLSLQNARQSIFTHQPESKSNLKDDFHYVHIHNEYVDVHVVLTALGFADPVSHSTKCPNTYQPPVTSRVKVNLLVKTICA